MVILTKYLDLPQVKNGWDRNNQNLLISIITWISKYELFLKRNGLGKLSSTETSMGARVEFSDCKIDKGPEVELHVRKYFSRLIDMVI